MPNGDFDIKLSYTLNWGGSVWLVDIRKAAKEGVCQALSIYWKEIVRTLSEHWGSIQYRGNARKTVAHSAPGQPPFQQTGNLANSVMIARGAKAAKLNGGAIIVEGGPTDENSGQEFGCVYTDVPYAKELEYGGIAGPYKASNLKHTSWILINPIRHMMYIAARPAWRPAYDLTVSQMIQVITKTMRNVMKRSYIR